MPINEEDRVRKLINVFGCLEPFSKLSDTEKDILGEYISGYLELRKLYKTKKKVFTKLFGYDYTNKISDNLSIDGRRVSPEMVRNYVSKLRKKGLLSGRSINDNMLILFDNRDNSITFEFEIKEDESNKN